MAAVGGGASLFNGASDAKIVRISTTTLSYNRADPMADALHYIPGRSAVLVHVETDSGLVGLGESAYFGGPPETTADLVERELAPLLIGENALDVERISRKLFYSTIQHGRRGVVMSALSGIDIALWDILGKAAKMPLHRLLGSFRTRLPVYASGGFYSEGGLDRLADELDAHVAAGFKAVKIKVGRDPSIPLSPLNLVNDGFCFSSFEADIERVRLARATVGPGVQLMVDANSGWDLATARKALPTLVSLGVRWLEEPVSVDDVSGSAQLVKDGGVPIAGYETMQGAAGFRDLLLARAIDIAQPDVTWTGGISECRRVGMMAACLGIPYAPHVFGSAVGFVANAHLLASLPNGLILEFDQTTNPLREELLTQPLKPDGDGTWALPEEAGLGIELDSDVVERYRLSRERISARPPAHPDIARVR